MPEAHSNGRAPSPTLAKSASPAPPDEGAPRDEGKPPVRGTRGRVHDVVIVGTGFAGVGMAIKLQEAGIRDFVLLERANAVGGTWRDNTYPGCACDVPSHLYSYSFEPKPDWSRAYSPQAEIRAYIEGCVDRHALRDRIHYGCDITRATWEESTQTWVVETRKGDVFEGRALVSGIGGLSNPAYAKVPGLETFRGETFHSATWNHDYPLEGKRVAVIGTGASAIQFVPRIQPKVAQLFVLQRTAPWVLPKPDRAYSEDEKSTFARHPLRRFLHRQGIYWRAELLGTMFSKVPRAMALAEVLGKLYIAKAIKNPDLRRAVTPTFVPGCKRVLFSNDYYPSLDQPNVELVTDPIARAVPEGLVLASGRTLAVDAIIHGTGFAVQSFLGGLRIHGRSGQELGETWGKTARAYRGTTVPGFPNLFMLLGPNTGLGHNSIIFMIEAQIRYVVSALTHMRAHGISAVSVRPEVTRAYNDALDRDFDGTVWASGCSSWYLNDEGKNTTLYPRATFTFRRETRVFRPDEYELTRAPHTAHVH
ncbi:MAG: NAD(P)/FAD-dependent oxidoreductase [Polyangiaceae bacterium]